MTNEKIGLILTLLLGLFILIGALISLLINKKEKVINFSIGLAFGVITMLIVTDLLPELIEELGIKNIHIIIIFSIVGYLILKILDKMIPDHGHDHSHCHSKKEHNEEMSHNLSHIGVITALALALHNIIEGMAVYSTIITNASLGLAVSIGVGFHNIPLGIVIGGAFYQSDTNKYKMILNIILVSLSTFVGGFIMFLLNITEINGIVLGILLSLTLGMLIYIDYNELLPRIKDNIKNKITIIGILTGIIILVIAMFI